MAPPGAIQSALDAGQSTAHSGMMVSVPDLLHGRSPLRRKRRSCHGGARTSPA